MALLKPGGRGLGRGTEASQHRRKIPSFMRPAVPCDPEAAPRLDTETQKGSADPNERAGRRSLKSPRHSVRNVLHRREGRAWEGGQQGKEAGDRLGLGVCSPSVTAKVFIDL